MKRLLFSECLQNDFVAPLPAGAALPNALHIGRAESRRLLGDPTGDWRSEGPLARFLAAWSAGAGDAHHAVHIRDWHDPADAATRPHLDHFGDHCVRGSEGGRFVDPLERTLASSDATVVDSAILSDFVGTQLEPVLRGVLASEPARAGVIGVWTDVKVRYLAYDLLTRLGLNELAVCSALTASSSRIHHREALEHMASSLGVIVIDSIPEFLDWLGIGGGMVTSVAHGSPRPSVRLPDGVKLESEERRLVEYLFRDCADVELEPLSGGFSGSRVFRSASVDRHHKREIPFVVKMDTHARVARERVAVESVENLLGAASPRLAEYVDLETKGAIKYQFATMHGGGVRTLQAAYRAAPDAAAVRALFDNVIQRVLVRLYQGPERDRLQLFQYYSYQPAYSAHTLAHASTLASAEGPDTLAIQGLDERLPHPRRFYAQLAGMLDEEPAEVVCCWVHGDLNLANVLLDDAGNTWMIDYFWTRIGHALQDMAKLENDIKLILVPLADDAALARAVAFERALVAQGDLLGPAPELSADLAADAAIAKAHAAIAALRTLAAQTLRDAGAVAPMPMREYQIAQLRYAAHTLSFDECDLRQRRFALASTCLLADALAAVSEDRTTRAAAAYR